MFGIDDLAIIGMGLGFSALAATAGEVFRSYLSRHLRKDLELQIKTRSGNTIKITLDSTGDSATDAAAVARALEAAQAADFGRSQGGEPAVPPARKV